MNYKSIIPVLLFSFLISTINAQVGVGTDDPQAALDINSTDSGLLLPRVDLQSDTDNTTVKNPNGTALVNGTMVWNTAATGIKPAGFYYWMDGEWTQVISSTQKTVHFGKMIIDASGSKIITGIGFKPSSIEFIAVNRVQNYNDGAYRSSSNNSNDVRMASGQMTGFATNYNGVKSQQVISYGTSGSSINNIGTYSSSNHCIAAYFVNNNGEAIHDNGQSNNGSDAQDGLIRASLTTFDNDGFTINVDKFLAGATSNDRTNQIVVIFKAYR
ncbi:hypothetical protein LX97_01510 [Nonlabens dokdonensis]|uniref:Lysyl-tRNA synthetase n=2 Tax=Nonlabens dokdonensis TaxID=328515 RepID=L7W9S0_NONDD|nr:hypothetical protein [Nonlabens dokdonensis]AGC76854.1 lysyl-tRNA synthetase [Nonlabens dokdonensis DSW-6]PZX44492.1 hypothetical protein LX97_01510 [Nonlabens dokdonensis]